MSTTNIHNESTTSKVLTLSEICYQCLARSEGREFIRSCQRGTTLWIPTSIVITILRRLRLSLTSKVLYAAEYLCPELIDYVEEFDNEFWKFCCQREFPLFAHVGPKHQSILLMKLISQRLDAARDYLTSGILDMPPQPETMTNPSSPVVDSSSLVRPSFTLTVDDAPSSTRDFLPWLERTFSLLAKCPMTISILRESRVGEAVNKLLKTMRVGSISVLCESFANVYNPSWVLIISTATEIVNKWKKLASNAKQVTEGVTTPSTSSFSSSSLSDTSNNKPVANVLSILDDNNFLVEYDNVNSWRSLQILLSKSLDTRYEQMAHRVRDITQRYRDSRSQALLVQTRPNADKRVRVPVPIITRTQLRDVKKRKLMTPMNLHK